MLVKRHTVAQDDDGKADDDAQPQRIADIVKDKKFVHDKLKLTSAKPVGWDATWWGETKFGPQYYLVRYAFKDAHIMVGPSWLVDLKAQKVVAKNVLAKVVDDPKKGVESEYYDKRQQVVSAITNHRFDSGVTLGGALLLYFSERAKKSDNDTILGWTIEHDRGNKFNAWFQWVEEGEPTYAEFKFDYDCKALKSVNLQAADIMRAGEKFKHTEAVDIMPRTYDAKAHKWLGPARRACHARRNRSRCKALASVLNEEELVETLEWLLTARANTPEDFEVCKKQHNCRFIPQKKDGNTYRVLYVFNLDKKGEFDRRHPDGKWACKYSLKAKQMKKKDKNWGSKGQCVAWDVNVKTGKITPVDHTSTLAYRAIHPRS